MPKKASSKKSARKRVTLQDVATAAGVSLGAASTALGNSKSNVGLKAETRERIIRVARELNYRPHAAARAMAGHAFNTIGVLAPATSFGSYFVAALRGVITQAEAMGYHVVVKMADDRLDLQNARIFNEELIDGVIIPSDAEPHLRESLFQFDIPHVWLHAGVEEEYNCVYPDEKQGMGLVVDHLYELGHRRIAYMPHDLVETVYNHIVLSRWAGYEEAMRSHGLEPIATFNQPMPIHEHIDLYLKMTPRPTAIVCHSDALAVLAEKALVKRRLRIPEDMSVTGYEGVLWHVYGVSELTTVTTNIEEMGRKAVQMLMERIESREPVKSFKFEHQLQVRESTGPPPADD